MIYCSSVRRVSVSSCNSYTCLDYTRSSHICQAFSTGGQAEQEIEEREQAFSLPPPPRPPARADPSRPSPGHPPVPRPPARGGPCILSKEREAGYTLRREQPLREVNRFGPMRIDLQ